MNRPRLLFAIGTVLVVVSLVGSPASAGEPPVEPANVSPNDVPHPGLELVANSKGWTFDQAAAQQHAADVVG
jgi:hypothetical protein